MTWSDYYEKINDWAVSTAVNKISRQQVAFLEECRKIKGYGSLREDFYTKYKPKKLGFEAVAWWKKRSISKIYMYWNKRCKICPFGIIVVHKVIVHNKKNYFTGGKCYAKFFYTKRTCKEP